MLCLSLVLASCDTVIGIAGNFGIDLGFLHTHSFTEAVVSDDYFCSAADCTTPATYYYSCKCTQRGDETFTTGEALGHSYNESVTAPTCTEDGYTTYTCSCGESHVADVITARGHSYTEYTSDGNASCYEEGSKTASCDNGCGCTDTQIDLGSSGHAWADGFCTGCEIPYFSEGMIYTLSEDGSAYTLSGIGECLDTVIVIPEYYLGIPVVAIGNGAFAGAEAIVEVRMPNSVTYIGENAFYLCINIRIVIFSDKLVKIGKSAFEGCTGLECVALPDSVTTIGESAFSGCTSLSEVTLGEGLTFIGDKAFYLCIKITVIIIPRSVTYIGSEAFGECVALEFVLLFISEDELKNLKWSLEWLGNCTANTRYGDDWSKDDGAGVVIYGDWYVSVAPGCLSDGVERRDALNVKDKYEERTLTATGHSYEATVTEPTCDNGGYTTYTCKGCSHSYVADQTEALGHSLVFHEAKEPTCTEIGWYSYYDCERCRYNTYSVIYELGHSYADKVCTLCGDTVVNSELYVRDGDFIYFGEYPQTIKADDVTITTEQDKRGYYLGSDGFYYAAVTATPLNDSYTFTNNAAIVSGEVYYFKVEPIRWRILKDYGESASLLCDFVVKSMAYQSSYSYKNINGKYNNYTSANGAPTGTLANNYVYSSVRKWLVEEFYNTAFTTKEQQIIMTRSLDNSATSTGVTSATVKSTNDKVYLISHADAVNANYGFASADTNDTARKMGASDYAYATGTAMTAGMGPSWWLRSASTTNPQAQIITQSGYLNKSGSDVKMKEGVVPAITIEL